ncbi:MAG: TetR/AcrR family transcriptional regulator [Pseudomonadota bacterium]
MTDSDKPHQTNVDKTALVDALFSALTSKSWHEIHLADLAASAKVGLTDLRSIAGSKTDIMTIFAEKVDEEVLEAVDEDLADEPARERLFDVLMARFDALADKKPGLKQLMTDVRRDPLLALELNRIAVRSQSWMLIGAGINPDGLMGAARVQGAVLAFSHVMRTWLKDDDEGLAATMAELDKTLRRGEEQLSRLDRALGLFQPRKRRSERSDTQPKYPTHEYTAREQPIT